MYRQARRLQVTPLQIDQMENWQIAELFGCNDDETDEVPQADGTRRIRSRSRDLVAERIAYAQGRGPKPEPDAMGAAEVSDMLGRLVG